MGGQTIWLCWCVRGLCNLFVSVPAKRVSGGVTPGNFFEKVYEIWCILVMPDIFCII